MTLPSLSRALVPAAERPRLAIPDRAAQFGTGAFLRGFIDFFVDAANRAGTFDGRVVAIGSTGSGRDEILEAQDGLYTLVSQGVVDEYGGGFIGLMRPELYARMLAAIPPDVVRFHQTVQHIT